MHRNSMLYNKYFHQSSDCSEPVSPLQALADPRFSSLFTRAANNRERANGEQVSPINWTQSPGNITVNSNAWLPTETPIEKSTSPEKKSCLSPPWKARLQGLLVGLGIAAILIGIILGVLLPKLPTNSPTSTETTTVATPTCSSLRWNTIGVTAAGDGTNGNGSMQFSSLWDIYVDANNTMYVADAGNHRIQQWLPNATNGTTVAGVTGVSGSNGSLLNYPRAVYGDSQQNLYVGDSFCITIWSPGASVGSFLPGSFGLGTIYAIFIDKNGNLYASTGGMCSIRMWTSTATVSTLLAGGNGCGPSLSQLYFVYGFAVDPSTNTIYAANSNVNTIVAWSANSTTGRIVAGVSSIYGATDFLLNYPTDVKRDQYGNLYVADANNHRILLFCQNPPSNSSTTIAGYQLSYARTITFDSNLNLYVVDPNNYRVQKYSRII